MANNLWRGWFVPDGDGVKPAPDDFDLTQWHQERTDWIIGQEYIPPAGAGVDILVSTVFLFLDHSHGFSEHVLWETMIFSADGTPAEDFQRRYCSAQEAREGHAEAVAAVKEMIAGGTPKLFE